MLKYDRIYDGYIYIGLEEKRGIFMRKKMFSLVVFLALFLCLTTVVSTPAIKLSK